MSDGTQAPTDTPKAAIDTPGIDMPYVDAPDAEAPDVEMRDSDSFGAETPNAETPNAEMPDAARQSESSGDDLPEAAADLTTGQAAQLFAQLVPAFGEATARDLRGLLKPELGSENPAELRDQRLGLVIDLIRDAEEEIPETRAYQDLHTERTGRGEEWPTLSSLLRAYGGWTQVVREADRLHTEGTAGGGPSDLHHAGGGAAYKRDEIVVALQRCRQQLGHWPTQWEYKEWAQLSRALARGAGKPMPRHPSLKPIRKLFGTWDRALAEAKRKAPEHLA